jgi:hypothetical protein
VFFVLKIQPMTRKDDLTDDIHIDTQDHFTADIEQQARNDSLPKYRSKYPPRYPTPPRTRKAIFRQENALR